MLTHMTLKNFKSWRNTGKIKIAPITALFGPNSSGKTSLLQILLLLKQTADSSDRKQVLNLGDERSLVELETFQDLLLNHDLGKTLEWELEWTLPERLEIKDPTKKKDSLFAGTSLSHSASIFWKRNGDQDVGRASMNRMSYRFCDHEFTMKPVQGGREGEYDLSVKPGDIFKFVRIQGRGWKLPPPVKCYGFPDQVKGYYQTAGFLSDFELQFEELFSRMYYLGPLRDYPRRQYTWAGSQPADMGRRGEKAVDAILASRDAGQKISLGKGHSRLTLEECVAKWLKNLGLIESFTVRPITSGGKLFQVWVRHAKGAEVLITDVGFGISQILPVIVLCYYAPEGSTILLEQPEIHLHPAVQAGLADVLIDAVRTRKIQIILESHSEHLLRRLQRRMAEEKLDYRDTSLYFCTVEKGGSRLIPLELDLFGTITNWPEGFFGDEFKEIAYTQEAIIQRKKKSQV